MPTKDNYQIGVFKTTTHIARIGDGQALLFLHGAGGSSNLEELREKLAEDYDVIVPDHPGFGRSEQAKQLNNYSIIYYKKLKKNAAINEY